MLTKTSPIQIKLKDVSETGLVTGYGSVFGNVDSHKDIVESGAFAKTIKAHEADGTMPKMLWSHKMGELPVGSWRTMKEDAHGLLLEGQFALDDEPMARRVHKSVMANRVGGLSIGFVPKVEEWDQEKGINRIKEVDLWEVSFVTFASNREAFVTDVKSDARTIRDLEALLRDERAFSRKEAAAIASRFISKDLIQRDAGEVGGKTNDAATRLIEIMHR